MTLVEDVAARKSVAIAGLAKNAGKTECLNYILKRLNECRHSTALTSIGVDGETTDAVCRTPKPEITVYENMLFTTSEAHYRKRRLTANILNVSRRHTALGRMVTAQTYISGKVILSGPSDTATLRRLIANLQGRGAKTVLVDGALSRLSQASPAVTEALVLATGAAVAATVAEVTRQTRFVCSLMNLPEVSAKTADMLERIEGGVWALDDCGTAHDLKIPTALAMQKNRERLFDYGTTLYCSGAVSDRLLQFLGSQKQITDTVLIMRDFTRMFASPTSLHDYQRRGGKIMVLRRNKLLAICVNPTSPQGYRLDSQDLCTSIANAVNVPVYDLMNHGHHLNTLA